MPKRLCAAVCLSWLAGTSAPSDAEIVLGGRDVNGVLDGSGTNKNPAPFSLSIYEASFGTYLATPISPHYFVTANHIGNGNGNGVLTFNNGTSTTTTYTATLAGASNDLAIWHVTSGAFSLYAPLFTTSGEVGKPIVGIGNGTTRGNPLLVNGQLSGWDVGQSFTNRSWQTNTVSAIATNTPGDDYLVLDFNRIADPVTGTVINPDEGIFSGGDSGGGVYVLDPSTGMYELGGINYGVYSVSLTSGGTPQTLALFDARGYYDYDPSTNANTKLITELGPCSSHLLRLADLFTPGLLSAGIGQRIQLAPDAFGWQQGLFHERGPGTWRGGAAPQSGTDRRELPRSA